MQSDHQVTGSPPLQIPPQPSLQPILLDTIQPILVQAIINPKRGMEGSLQPEIPQSSNTCGSPAGKSCWSLDMRVAMLLLTLAAAMILLLLYRLLQLRHRLRLARARHALEYSGFYRAATYTLKHPPPCQDPTLQNGTVPEPPLQVQTVTTAMPVTITPLPPPPPAPCQPPLPLPPSPTLPPPSLQPTPTVLSLPLPLPVIHTTPPSPHLSWGACSDVDIYSRIGAFRTSRLSGLSTHSKVILFEHSSL